MLFFHPVRRARRAVQPRSVRKALHPVRSAAWTASGVGRKRPAKSSGSGAEALVALAIVVALLLALHV